MARELSNKQARYQKEAELAGEDVKALLAQQVVVKEATVKHEAKTKASQAERAAVAHEVAALQAKVDLKKLLAEQVAVKKATFEKGAESEALKSKVNRLR